MRVTLPIYRTNYGYLIDATYRKMLGSRVFPAGWGDAGRIQALLDFHKQMSSREKCQDLVDKNPSVSIHKVKTHRKYLVFDGQFLSPFAQHMPGLMPEASENCRFQLCVPKVWETVDRPIAIHMAGTGDMNFWRRRNLLAWSLIREHGIGSVIIENPFYGLRKPPEQVRSNVRFVSDIFVMGGGLMLESLVLLRWLENNGYGPFCMTGISMGGHMASLGASNYTKPVGLAPCLSWTTASSVFTRGVMTNAINWRCAKSQYFGEATYREEIWDRLRHYELMSSKEYMERTKYFRELAHARSPDLPKQLPAPTVSKTSEILKKLAKVVGDLKLPKVLPSFSRLPAFPFSSSSLVDFLIGKQSSIISFTLVFPFLDKLKRQSGSSLPNFESKLHKFEGKEMSDERGIRTFYKRDKSTCLESLEFMRRLMDHFTHLSNFEKPIDPELAVVIAARNDAYVLRDGVTRIEEIWPGCTVRYLDTGHVVAYVLHHHQFRQAICDTINKHREKYYTDGTPRPLGPEPPKPLSIRTISRWEKCVHHASEVHPFGLSTGTGLFSQNSLRHASAANVFLKDGVGTTGTRSTPAPPL